jgi:hypothetical protein
MIARLLPAHIACADFEGDDPSARLLPGEEPALSGAVQSRIGEFTTARSCARRALLQFGVTGLRCPAGHIESRYGRKVMLAVLPIAKATVPPPSRDEKMR